MPEKRKRGRPALPPGERGSGVNTWLTPAERAHVEQLGDGSAPAGIRVAISESIRRARRRKA